MSFKNRFKLLRFFEFSDQKWLPKTFRNYLTNILEYHLTMDETYKDTVSLLTKVSKKTANKNIIDLCSGSGGALKNLAPLLLKEGVIKRIILTDKYPCTNIKQNYKNVIYEKQSIDALRIPNELKGIRTFYSSFHHFSQKDGRRILSSAIDEGQPICIFEFTQRKISNIIGMLLSPLVVFLCTPFIKPFSFWRLLWTYIIPIVPLIYWWDGTISHIRTYSVNQLKQLAEQADKKNKYHWEIGILDEKSTTYLMGYLKYK